MMFSLRRKLRIGLCRDRLVIGERRRPTAIPTADPIGALPALSDDLIRRSRLEFVVSNHFLRYAVLPWNGALASRDEWHACAILHFRRVYGNDADAWHVVVASAAKGHSRVACAMNRELRDALQRLQEKGANVHSAVPYFTRAFNSCRRHLPDGDCWFVVQEPGSLTLGLMTGSQWKSVRRRTYQGPWEQVLLGALEREAALSAGTAPCERVCIWAEDIAASFPKRLGRYAIADVTGGGRTIAELRRYAMVLQ